MRTRKPRDPWTTGEKLILGTIIIGLSVAAIATALYLDLNAEPVIQLPERPLPYPNGYNTFMQAANAAAEIPPDPSAMRYPPRPPKPWIDISDPRVSALAAVNDPAVRLMERGLSLPYLPRPLWEEPIGNSFSAAFRRLARVIMFEAQVAGLKGDYDSELRYCLDDVAFGARIPEHGSLLHLLTGDDCQAVGRWTLWPDVSKLDRRQCARAIMALEAIDARPASLVDALRESKMVAEAEMMPQLRKANWRTDLLDHESSGRKIAVRDYFISKRQVMRDLDAMYDAEIVAAQRPYGTVLVARQNDPFVDDDDWFERSRCNYARNLAGNRLLLTSIALRAYRLDHGAFPHTLAALVPDYLTAVPLDPFTDDQPLIYRLDRSTFIIYSVGPDMHDDGGNPITGKRVPSNRMPLVVIDPSSKGDMVAGIDY